MITEKEYLEAQKIVDKYKEQLKQALVISSLPDNCKQGWETDYYCSMASVGGCKKCYKGNDL